MLAARRVATIFSFRTISAPLSPSPSIGSSSGAESFCCESQRRFSPSATFKKPPASKSLSASDCGTDAQPEAVRSVVVVGWLGAKSRYVAKYVKLWEDTGHKATAIRPRTSSILFPALGDLQAGRFLEVMAEQHTLMPSQKVVLHIFSNAGFIFMGTVFRLSRMTSSSRSSDDDKHAWMHAIDGIIFDSAPAPLDADMAARGFVAASLGEAADGVGERHPLIVSASRQALSLLLGNAAIAKRYGEVLRAWEVDAPLCRQLYIYSLADVLIPKEGIENFVACQEARGVQVEQMVWESAPHCEHFRIDPIKYSKRVEEFVNSL